MEVINNTDKDQVEVLVVGAHGEGEGTYLKYVMYIQEFVCHVCAGKHKKNKVYAFYEKNVDFSRAAFCCEHCMKLFLDDKNLINNFVRIMIERQRVKQTIDDLFVQYKVLEEEKDILIQFLEIINSK